MSTQEQRLRVRDLLLRVAHGETTADDAVRATEAQEWNDIPWEEREINNAWHTLVHFQIDSDIRARDSKYDAALRAQLLEHARKLGEKAD